MGNLNSYLYNIKGELNILGKLLLILLICIAGAVIFAIIKKLLFRVLNRGSKDDPMKSRRVKTVLSLLYNVIKIIIYFFIFVFFLDLMGVNTSSLIATAGIASVALGFGAQSLVKDALSGVFILTEDQFAVGEYVKIMADKEHEGTITDFSVRSTKITDSAGAIHFIPNGEIHSVINYSRENFVYYLTYPVSFFVDVNLAIETAKEAVTEVYERDEISFLNIPPEVQGITGFTENYYKLQIMFYSRVSDQWRLSRAVNTNLLLKWEEKKFAPPLSNILVKGD